MPIMEETHSTKRILMVGIGILPELHVTRQAEAGIKRSGCVAYFSDPRLESLFDELGVDRRFLLDDLYLDGGVDQENYDSILRHLVALVESHMSVAFVCQGNPRLGVTLTDMLESAKLEEGFALEIIPGLSSFEALMVDAKRDPLEYGTILIDANRWLLFDYIPNPHLDHYIYHVCSVATRKTHFSDASVNNGIDLLQASLTRSYPAGHKCKLMKSAGAGENSAVIHECTVDTLVDALPYIDFGTTLYLPSVGYPSPNEEILAKLMAS